MAGSRAASLRKQSALPCGSYGGVHPAEFSFEGEASGIGKAVVAAAFVVRGVGFDDEAISHQSFESSVKCTGAHCDAAAFGSARVLHHGVAVAVASCKRQQYSKDGWREGRRNNHDAIYIRYRYIRNGNIRKISVAGAQCGQLLRERVELGHDFAVLALVGVGFAGFDKECTAGLQFDAADVVQVGESLFVQDGEQVVVAERLALHGSLVDFSVTHQNGGSALQQAREFWRAEEGSRDEPVDGQKRKCSNNAAGHCVVFADDGILYGVGEGEQDDEVEGVELGQFTLAEDAQEHDQNEVDDDRADEFFKHRERQVEHVAE